MSFWVKSTTLTMGYGGVGGGAYMVYDSVSPRTIRERLVWEGAFLLDESDTDLKPYKSKYVENKEEIKKVVTSISSNETNLNTAAGALKAWCSTQFSLDYSLDDSENTMENVKSWCSDGFKTVKGRLLRISDSTEGLLRTSEEDYRVIFALYKSNSDFIGFISSTDAGKDTTADTEDGHTKLKGACDELVEKKHAEVDDSKLRRIYWWCTPPEYCRVKDKLESDKYEMETEESKFQDLFEKWKHTESVMDNLKTKNSALTKESDKQDGGNAMKSWCEEQKEKKLSDKKIYPETYIQVKFVCSKRKDA